MSDKGGGKQKADQCVNEPIFHGIEAIDRIDDESFERSEKTRPARIQVVRRSNDEYHQDGQDDVAKPAKIKPAKRSVIGSLAKIEATRQDEKQGVSGEEHRLTCPDIVCAHSV